VEEADGRGEPGRRDGGAGSGAAARGRRGGAWRLKELLTCGSHMSGREREGERGEERGGGGVGRVGRNGDGPRELGWVVRLVWFLFFFFFSVFSFSFQILFKQNSNSNLFHVFKLKF
jgi:hypothetical protein